MSVNHDKAAGAGKHAGSKPAQAAPAAAPKDAAPAAPAPTEVVGEIVGEQRMQADQQAAASASVTPIAAHIPPETEQKMTETTIEPAPVVEQSVFHSMNITVMVTLDMSQPYMVGTGLKGSLSKVNVGDTAFNLYSPFRKAGKPKGDEKPAAEGILREALTTVFDITDQVNSSRIMCIGAPDEILGNLRASISAVRSQIEHSLPIGAAVTLLELEGEDAEAEDEPFKLQFENLVKVTSWLNSPRIIGAPDEISTAADHNAVINFNVNAGALYDAEEPVKYIGQIEAMLRNMIAKRGEESSTTVLLSVMMNPADLAEQTHRDLLDMLLGEKNFALYTRNEMNTGEAQDWLPMNKGSVERDLLSANGDLLLVLLVGDEEPEADDAEPGEPGVIQVQAQ